MDAQRKFIDRDLLADPGLVTTATIYAVNYTGTFEFMLAAKEAAQATGTLSLPVARGVLNCMRVDPTASRHLPDLPEWGADDGAVANVTPIRGHRPYRDSYRTDDRYVRETRAIRPLRYLDVPAVPQFEWAASAHKQAYVYHKVELFWMRWELIAWDENVPDTIIRKPTLEAKFLCGQSPGWNTTYLAFKTEAEALEAGYRQRCASCHRMIREREEAESLESYPDEDRDFILDSDLEEDDPPC